MRLFGFIILLASLPTAPDYPIKLIILKGTIDPFVSLKTILIANGFFRRHFISKLQNFPVMRRKIVLVNPLCLFEVETMKNSNKISYKHICRKHVSTLLHIYV